MQSNAGDCFGKSRVYSCGLFSPCMRRWTEVGTAMASPSQEGKLASSKLVSIKYPLMVGAGVVFDVKTVSGHSVNQIQN